MQIRFTKMHGLGNDFMVVDAVTQKVYFSNDLIKRLGDRHFGVGFDQLLLVEPPYSPENDFHYRIFNQDGSEVQMCGNGARCFARFVVDHGLCNKREIKVSTMANELTLKIEDDGEVVVNMGVPILEPSKIPCLLGEQKPSYELPLTTEKGPEAEAVAAKYPVLTIGSVSMGNPHMTTIVDDVDNFPVKEVGTVLERHSLFPEKVNVGFMQIISSKEVKLRVFERGCGETMACGTGACAAAVAGMVQGKLEPKVKVRLPGGNLSISWAGEGQPVLMKGSATKVYEGVIDI